MKYILLLLFVFTSLNVARAQTLKDKYKQELIELNKEFIDRYKLDSTIKIDIKKYQAKFLKTTNDTLINHIVEKNIVRKLLQKEKDSLFHRFLSYSLISKDEGLTQKTIDSLFVHHNYIIKDNRLDINENQEPKENIYTYFGDDKVVNENFLDEKKQSKEAEIIKQVLSEKSESYLGDITIPKDNQKLYFYKYKKDGLTKLRDKNLLLFKFYRTYITNVTKTRVKDDSYRFKKIELEIRDANFADIKVYVEYKGNIHIFENLVGISLLRYSTIAKKSYLAYKQTIINNDKFILDDLKELSIRLGDVMVYNYSMGSHFIPNNLALSLPKDDVNEIKTNLEAPATYKIKQETDLDKVVELRTFTDFLALFGESNNGLIQIEGKAKFYVFPLPFQIKTTKGIQAQFFPTISPNVNFSRLDEKVQYVENELDTISNKNFISSPLELVEKRFLTMGLEANVFQIEHKDFPVNTNISAFANYQLSEVNLGTDSIPNIHNIKAFSYGGGLHFSAKRFSNFGFNYKLDFSWFDYKNFNTIEMLTLPDKLILTTRNEAEIYYYATKKPNSAIFIRLITYNNSSSKNNNAFYQFQFGYKFSIGSRSIN